MLPLFTTLNSSVSPWLPRFTELLSSSGFNSTSTSFSTVMFTGTDVELPFIDKVRLSLYCP